MKNWYNVTLIILIFFSLSGISHSTKDFIWVKDWISEKFKSKEAIESDRFSQIENETIQFFEKSDYSSMLNLESLVPLSEITQLKINLNSLSDTNKKKLKSDIKEFLTLKLKYYNFHLKCSKNYLATGKYVVKDSVDFVFPLNNVITSEKYIHFFSNGYEIKNQLSHFNGDKLLEELEIVKKENLVDREKNIVNKLMINRYDLMKLMVMEYELIYEYYFFQLFNERLSFNKL